MTSAIEILKNLESQNNIKIIYAVEAGSRSHGWESDTSDYDIRFVFMLNNRKSYLSLQESNNPITGKTKAITGKSDDEKFEWQGWDLSQFLKRLQELNLTAIEWIYSSFVHLQLPTEPNFLSTARSLVESQKRIKPIFDNYLGTARENYTDHVLKEEKVRFIYFFLYNI